jgi:hypothetical protein
MTKTSANPYGTDPPIVVAYPLRNTSAYSSNSVTVMQDRATG